MNDVPDDDVGSYVAMGPPGVPMPNPTPEMLSGDRLFDAIWSVIKTWDVNVPSHYQGYCGANGSHVAMIYESIDRHYTEAVTQSVARAQKEREDSRPSQYVKDMLQTVEVMHTRAASHGRSVLNLAVEDGPMPGVLLSIDGKFMGRIQDFKFEANTEGKVQASCEVAVTPRSDPEQAEFLKRISWLKVTEKRIGFPEGT